MGCMLENTYTIVSESFKVILVRAQREKRATDRSSVYLENTQIILKKNVEI